MRPNSNNSDPRLTRRLALVANVAAILAVVMGVLALTGWALNVAVLKSVVPGQASMKPVAALALALAGVALWLQNRAGGGVRQRLGRICAGLVAAIGALVLLEYLTGLDFGIDQLLFRQAVLAENVLPIGRPAPATAFCLLLLGAALLLDARPTWLASAGAVVALLVGALAVMGYAYEVTTLYQIGPYVPIALHTALAIVVLSLGILAARPTGPLVAPLTTQQAGSIIGRRLLLAVFVVPFSLGWLRVIGQRLGWYDTGFGVALLVTSNVAIFAVLVFASVRLLNQASASREAADAALRLNEENLRLMLDSIRDHAIFMLDPDGRVATWNKTAERIKGYTAAEIIGRPVSVFYPAEAAAAGKPQQDLQAAAAHGSIEEEGLRVRKDGSTFWAIADTAALRDAQGVLRGYSKVTRDITERKQAESALREREERLRVLADATPNGLIIIADNGEITWANQRARVLFAIEDGQLIGRSIDELVPARSRGTHAGRRAEFAADRRSHVMGAGRDPFGLRQDGSEFPVEIGLSAVETAQGKLTLASITDITERKASEAALRQSEERFAKAFRASPAAMSVTRLGDRRFVDVNDQFLQLFGFQREEVVGRTSDEIGIFSDRAERVAPAGQFRAEGSVRNAEMALETKSGQKRNVLFSMEVIELSGEAHALAILIDNTERRRAEDALRQLNADLEARVAQRTADLAASEVKFRTVFDVLPVGVSILDDHEQLVESNASVVKILQMSSQKLAAGVFRRREYFHPDGTPVRPDEFPGGRAVRERLAVGPMEMSSRTEDGQIIWIEASSVPIPLAGFGAVVVTSDLTERKRIEADLRQSEERFAQAFRYSPLALTITRSADGVFVDANEGFLNLFGYSREEVMGRPATELNIVVNPDERAAMFKQFHEQGYIRNFEMVRRTKAGEFRHVLLSADRMVLNGEAHILTTMLDMTASKNAEAALRESEIKFRTLFGVLPVGVSILDRQRRIVESNPALAQIIRLSDEGLAAGMYASRRIIRPDGSPMPLAEYASVRASEEQRLVPGVETGMVLETGETVWLDISAAPLPVEDLGVVAVTVDISERKKAEAALRESEEKFSKSFHASGAGIVISRTSDGHIMEANDSYVRLVGYAREEMIGRTTLEIGAITPAVREQLVTAIREQGHVHDMEIGVVTKSGEARTVSTSTETIRLGDEDCLLSILYDITERKRVEQALASERDLLQALMDNIPDTIYFKDRASRFTRVNLAQSQMLGAASPAMVVGKTDADFQSSPLAAEFYAEEQRLLDSGRPLIDRLEFNPTSAGERRWLSATKVPLKDAHGDVVGLVGISRDVTARVMAEEDLQRLNQELADRVNELALLNELDEQLQTCQAIEDTYPLIARIMGQLAPAQSGRLYRVEAAQASLAAAWGVPGVGPQAFGADDCWALRLGQAHLVEPAHAGLTCRHLLEAVPLASLCMPLLAQGQAMGVLHLSAADETSVQAFSPSIHKLARVVAETVALTWANLTLRASLRQQAIRDPLTDLFNRRFMEESLARELHRAARNKQSVGMIMMDIDGFKKINDRMGHETGDAVLRGLGRLLQSASRGSDIPCRYGGEEFLLILPEASLEVTHQRAEQIRVRCQQMEIEAAGGPLGTVTLSLGVAAYPQHGDVLEAVLRAADSALYQAKAAGRDRTMLAAG